MDPVKILQRAWHILWNYRTLWVFGLILALVAGGSLNGNGNNGMPFGEDGNNNQQPTPQSMQEFFRNLNRELNTLFREGIPQADISGEALTAFLWTIGVFVVFMLLIGIAVTIAYYVSATSVIRMVDEYENTGTKVTVREGFRMGWSRAAWRLFLINLIVSLPLILFFLVLLVVGVSIFLPIINGDTTLTTANIVSLVGLTVLGGLAVITLSFLLSLLRPFFWRVCVLEGAGVRESLRQGFALVRNNWKSVGLMWLVMIGLGIAWVVVSLVAIIVTLPIIILTSLVAIIVAAIPILLLVGLFSLFLTGPLPWVAAVLFMLPLFLVIAFSPWLLLGSWKTVYASTVWTLTYREIRALSGLAPQTEIIPAAD